MKKTNNFWNWFFDNQFTIKNILKEPLENQESICYWIKQNLNYYCYDIDFILVLPNNDNKIDFIITANGNPEFFKQVIALVDSAPILKGWKFTAFITTDETIEKRLNRLDQHYIIHDIKLKEDLSEYIPINLESCPTIQTIHIHLKNYTIRCSNKTIWQSIYYIFEEILGDLFLYETIHFVQETQTIEQEILLINLYELQRYNDNFNIKQNQPAKI
ncbi:hypothetical protein [Flavobacterium sp. 120]|uniref:hypothetical protein n=1 Tax=Flavobacterium sp. 120 TaxID=2135626 RepID=UPI000EB3367A|nr:hypothetical protein [Flavobacterium sp. 120]RKS14305.1 hypothetical protein C8C87_1579 [Flavobacterium sp. 120]